MADGYHIRQARHRRFPILLRSVGDSAGLNFCEGRILEIGFFFQRFLLSLFSVYYWWCAACTPGEHSDTFLLRVALGVCSAIVSLDFSSHGLAKSFLTHPLSSFQMLAAVSPAFFPSLLCGFDP